MNFDKGEIQIFMERRLFFCRLSLLKESYRSKENSINNDP